MAERWLTLFAEPPLLTLPSFLSSLQLRFRQEYRLERKVLAELDLDPATQDDGELSALLADGPASTGRHLISRVVVLHNDKLETFHNESSSPCKPLTSDDDDAFFDSDSFWSGSITWY
jgi:hypothetical protein